MGALSLIKGKQVKKKDTGVIAKPIDTRTTWEKIFGYTFAEHDAFSHRVMSSLLRAVIKPFMFNMETRISFFAGIKANDDSGGLQGFLDSQRYICRELKSSYLPFYKDLSIKYGPDSLYKTLKPYYPSAEVSIFSAGETSNNMKTACDVAITFLNRSHEIKTNVKTFIGTIGLYVVLAVGFVVAFSQIISDQINNLFKHSDKSLPDITQFYFDMNTWIESYLIYVIVIVVALCVAFATSLNKGTGKARQFAHKWVPGYRFYRRYVSCTFLLSLSAMLGAGMSFNEAINTVRRSNSLGKKEKDGYIGRYMADIQRKLNGGSKPQKALDVDLMPKAMYLNVAQFIKGNDIGLTLLNVAEFELDKLSRSINSYKRMSRILIFGVIGILLINGYRAAMEPALTMFQGGY